MKLAKILCAVAVCLAFGAGKAKAGENTLVIGYSQLAITGFRCSSGTVSAQVNASRPSGFTGNVAKYRITNEDATNAVWIGGASVSTATANGDSLANLGEKIAAGNSVDLEVGKNYASSGVPLVPFYCKAADAAGAAGIVISVRWLGY